MRTHVMELVSGDQLKSDTFNQAGLHVLAKGTRIRNEEIALLIRQSIDYVDIEPRQISIDGSSEEEQSFAHSFSQRLRDNFEFTIQAYQSVFLEALTNGKINQDSIEEKFLSLLEVVDERKDVVSLLLSLGREDVNLYNHSLQVGLLSFYIAIWLGYSREESYEVSKAGYLHDIGKSKVRQSIRNHPEDLSLEELDELKRHTSYGYELIRKSLNDEALALAALQHHELEDGSGYPLGIGKGEIHPYAQIVAVANAYIERTSSRSGEPKPGLLTILKEIHELGFGKLNEKPVQALTRNLLPNFIGKNAKLSTGETATIVYNNPTDIFRPLVKVGEEFRDLSKERDISIEEIFIQ
ncbi:HD family phosphohydrolase [Paenibacillus sp. CAA11]|uniref:HD-GYP domain-containing protein n=1 Tax=Paenibacillus sp. CAA11 TaxID=1532905 RepID=UPI000D383BA2|nr:HD domain-containing phosphohydrolase [Paenibacillus sp. CAA11]AWB44920.1 HD family phosphohydrolase [Paenibacillus sp. CAA11]